MYKHIFFDCAETLLYFEGVRLLTQRLGGDKARAERIQALTFGSPVWLDFDRDRIPFSSVVDTILSCFDEADRPHAAWYLDNYLDFFSVIDGTPELLAELKAAGYKLYVLSDFARNFDHFLTKFSFFDLFDGLVVSYQHGVSKYDHGLFPRILELYGLDPAECIFFDDRAVNIEAAAEFGIAGHVYTSVADTRRVLGL